MPKKKWGYEIVGEYHDVGSAGKGKQPYFWQMFEHAKQGGFDCVIVTGFDRISRKMADCFAQIDELKKHGVKVQSVIDNAEDWIREHLYFEEVKK